VKNGATAEAANVLTSGALEELAGLPAAPLRLNRRLPALDYLRGFALLGILMMNIDDFAGPEGMWDIPVDMPKAAFTGWHAHLDIALVILRWLLGEGRMRSLFSILFGAGVVLLTVRLEHRRPGKSSADIYYRRNLWLLFFGLCHGFLIWWGDILVDYAVIALTLLYPLRRLHARTLLMVGMALWLAGGTFGSTHAMHTMNMLVAAPAQLTPPDRNLDSLPIAERALQQEEYEANVVSEMVEGKQDYLKGWKARIAGECFLLRLKFGSLWILEWLGAMVTGMGLYKSGFLTNQRPRREYAWIALVCYAVSVPITLTGLWHVFHADFRVASFDTWMALPYSTTVAAGTLANTSVILLLLRSGRFKHLFGWVAAVGRTAFSNYILTSVLLKTVFSWGPWKLYGELEFYQWACIVVAVWALNLCLSASWLHAFAFGPMEWLWRSLTYWKLQPWRLSSYQ
jgi:uncharacterized protein